MSKLLGLLILCDLGSFYKGYSNAINPIWYVHTFWYQKDKVIDSFYIQWVTGNLKTNEACYN